jgi:PAS domain S-box-containing protein
MTLTLFASAAVVMGLAALLLIATRAREDAARRLDRLQKQIKVDLATVEQQRDVFLQIVNSLDDGLLAIDDALHIVLTNPRFAKMFGLRDDAIGSTLGEVIRAPAVYSVFDSAVGGIESEARFSFRIGAVERKIEVRAFPLQSEDIAAVGLFTDVTHVERLEQIRRNFISDFSHEARTPLAALRSAVDTYDVGEHRMSAEDDRQLRRIISRQVVRLERLVDDLSELSRIESGDLSLERSPVDLRRLIDDLCEDFADRAAQKRLRLIIRGNGASVSGDPMRLQQAFSNLIDNAIKYGGEDNSIEIEVVDEPDAGRVRITDHGEGIQREEMEHIFRRFYRVDKSRSQEIAGTGLGLAIAKHLLRLHHGTIDVESEPGKGATFIVSLPKSAFGHDF